MSTLDLNSLGLDDTQRLAIESELNLRQTAVALAEAEIAVAKRQQAVMRVGVDTSKPMGKLFADHYDGDITDEVALRQAALDMGIPLVGGLVTPVIPPVDDGSTDARNALVSGASNAGDGSIDPREVAKTVYEASLKRGSGTLAAMADSFHARAYAAYEEHDARGLIP